MPRTKDQASRGVGNTRDKGKDAPAPTYKAASIKGLTSKDPGNVARNRAGAAKYGTVSQRIAASGRDGNADKAATQAAYRAASARTTAPSTSSLFAAKQAAAAAAPAAKPGMLATKAPAGYRPGIDPEYNYRAGTATAPTSAMAPRSAMAATAAPMMARVKPTITLAKGGKSKGKKK